MIPSLPELTISPTSPTSAIAPPELIGTSPFPALLQSSQPNIPVLAVPLNQREQTQQMQGFGQQRDREPTTLAEFPRSDRGLSAELRPAGSFTDRQVGNLLPDDGNLLPRERAMHTSSRLSSIGQDQAETTFRAPLAASDQKAELAVQPNVNPASRRAPLPEVSDASADLERSPGTPQPAHQPLNTSIANPRDPVVERDTTHLPKHSAETSPHDKSQILTGREVSRVSPKAVSELDVQATPAKGEGQPEANKPSARAEQPSPSASTMPAPTQSSSSPAAQIAATQGAPSPLVAVQPEPTEGTLPLKIEPSAAMLGAVKPGAIVRDGVDAVLVSRPEFKDKRGAEPQSRPSAEALGVPAEPRILPAARGTREQSGPARPVSGASDVLQPPQAGTSSATSPSAAAQSASSQAPQVASTPATPTSSPVLQNMTDVRSDIRPGQTVASTIEQMADLREAGRAARPELTMRHHEFGAINMRIETAGTDLRATLASRDPGFVPAVQAALAERAVSGSSESGSTQSNSGRNSDQSGAQNGAATGNSSGSGGFSEGRYGSSTGSGQGSSQPYREQSGSNEEQRATKGLIGSQDPTDANGRDTGLFA